MKENKPILEFVEKASLLLGKYYSDYVIAQLKKENTLNILHEIILKSNKAPSEAVLALLASIKYFQKDINAFIKLEKNDSFQEFIKDNYDEIVEISINKKVQGNAPERGLPILEVLGKMLPVDQIAIIELGASYGLIGSCLLNYEILLNENALFQFGQKLPQNPKGIEYYVGIDIDPPDKEWLLACCPDMNSATQISNFIDFVQQKNSFQILKVSAFGFSGLKEIKELIEKKFKIVVLTSFMLYQLDEKKQKLLIDEISEFTHNIGGHWIYQDVEFPDKEEYQDYFIEWDGTRIIKLMDDSCSDWNWISK